MATQGTPADELPLREQAYQRLLSDIVSCRLAPGERVSERKLAERTGFGIAPIRDALRRLDQDGLVDNNNRQGYRVAPITLKSIDELFSVGTMLGTELLRRAVPLLRAADIQKLEGLQAHLEGGTADEIGERIRIDGWQIIELMIDVLGNRYFKSFFDQLFQETQRVAVLLWTRELAGELRELWKSRGWFEAIRRRDGEEAARLLNDMLAATHRASLDAVLRIPSVADAAIKVT